MVQTKKIAGNLLFTFSSRAIEIIAGLAVVALLSRYLNLEEFGAYSVLLAVMWVVLPLLNAGYPRILVREISQHKNRAVHFLMIGCTWNILVSLGLAAILLLSAYWFTGQQIILFAFVLVTVTIMALTQTFATLYIAFQRMHYETGPTLLTMLLLLLFIGALVRFDLGLTNIFAAYALAYLAGLALTVKLTSTLAPYGQHLAVNLAGVGTTFKESLYIGIFQLLVQLYLYSGVFILKLLADNADIALFQAPFRIFTRLQIIPMSFMPVLLPIFSRLLCQQTGKSELQHTSIAVFKIMMLISLFLTIITFSLADTFVPMLLGSNFTESATVFKILSLSTCFFFLNTVFDTLFIASRRITLLTSIQAGGLLVCAAANFMLVPHLSFLGSSWAIFISSGMMTVAGFYCFKDILPGIFAKIIATTGAGAVTGWALTFLTPAWPVAGTVLLGVSAYILSIFLFKIITLSDISLLLNSLQAKQNDRSE